MCRFVIDCCYWYGCCAYSKSQKKQATDMKKEAGKFMLDIAKLLIGGVLFTGIMRQDISPKILFSIGGLATAIVIAVAFSLIWFGEKQNKR
jgi:uncharacterized membrane protein YraQ (UPF0718 family)